MKTIILLAVIIGFIGIVGGVATMANDLDLTLQKMGIFDFSIIQSQNCPSGLCAIEVKSSNEINELDMATKYDNDDDSITIMKEDSFEGCPVSFWGSISNSEHWPTGYIPDDKYGHSAYFNESIQISLGKDPTFNDALQSKGGDGINKLARQSVAALLNSAHSEINYPLSIIEIISKTQKSIKDQEYSFAGELALNNNLGKGTFCYKLG